MKNWIQRHGHALHSSFAQLSHATFTTLLTFAVIGIALALPTGLFVLIKNVETLSFSLKTSGRISIYLNKEINAASLSDVLEKIRRDRDIAKTEYISPDVGLKLFQEDNQFPDIFSALPNNPLPGVVIATPASEIHTIAQIEALAKRLKQLPYVQALQIDTVWLKRLNAILQLGQRLAFGLMLLFGLGVILIIGNTIRLTLQNHQHEMMVIKLLGGTDFFIQRPFLYSGMIYGLMGGIVAWFLVDALILFLQPSITELMQLYHGNFYLHGLDFSETLFFLLGSMLLGLMASWVVAKKYIAKLDI